MKTIRQPITGVLFLALLVFGSGIAALAQVGGYGYDRYSRLTGTFRLDASRSDDTRYAVERSVRYLPALARDRAYNRLLNRLESPEILVIEQRGRQVTLGSSSAPQTTLVADGRVRAEQLPNGRTMRTNARLTGNQLVISSTGFRDNDFSVTFQPIDNGRRLRVIRSVYTDRVDQPVVVRSIYDRISDVAQFDTLDYQSRTLARTDLPGGDALIRDGELLEVRLDTPLSTRWSRDGERFRMTVITPAEHEGAVIEGSISELDRSGRIGGRSEIHLNFDTIRMRNGQTYAFAGVIEDVRTPDGDVVRVDTEGTVRERSQTGKTVERTTIGGAVGAIIGAITGGGKGAAIGAAIGAGAGAGSVYVQGRDDLDLPEGSTLTVRTYRQ